MTLRHVVGSFDLSSNAPSRRRLPQFTAEQRHSESRRSRSHQTCFSNSRCRRICESTRSDALAALWFCAATETTLDSEIAEKETEDNHNGVVISLWAKAREEAQGQRPSRDPLSEGRRRRRRGRGPMGRDLVSYRVGHFCTVLLHVQLKMFANP